MSFISPNNKTLEKKGYRQSNLAWVERPLFFKQFHPFFLIFFVLLILPLSLFIPFSLAIDLIYNPADDYVGFFMAIFVSALVLIPWFWIWHRKSTFYGISEKSVIKYSGGLLGPQLKEVAFGEIKKVSFKATKKGDGDLILICQNDQRVELPNIPNVRKAYVLLQSLRKNS